MKKIILLFGVLLISICTSAQDIIYRVDGSEIRARVIEIIFDTIKYKNFGQLESPLLKISISDVFMIIYEGGEREIFKTKKQNDENNQINNTKHSIISKNNVSIDIIDSRYNKILIGERPSAFASAVGLIVQPNVPIKDNEKNIYSSAEETLKNVLEKKGFIDNNSSSSKLEIKILELSHIVKAGTYGLGGNITQVCRASISLSNNKNLIVQKDFNSLYVAKTKVFCSQHSILSKQYSDTFGKNSVTIDKKEIRRERRSEKLVEDLTATGNFIDFLIVFDDMINQLLSDNEFQSIIAE